MAAQASDSLINFGLFGHHGAGKTSLAEAILYTSKAIGRLGTVEESTTVMDFEPEEKQHKMSLSSGFFHFNWKKQELNLLDTPGESNFFADARGCMQAVETAVVVVDGVDSFKVNAEKSLVLSKELNLSRALVINRLDKDRADFDRVFADAVNLGKELGITFVPVTLPIGAGANLEGMVDLVAMQAYGFKPGDSGELEKRELPESASKYRDKLVEAVAETDDALTEKYLEAGDLTAEELTGGLRQGIVSGLLAPVFATAATNNWGTPLFLDYIAEFFPKPTEKQHVLKVDGDNVVPLEGKEGDPFCGLVVKTLVDPYAGHLSVLRVFAGHLDHASTVYNSNRRHKERVGNILRLKGDKQDTIPSCGFGDIVALPKLKSTATGDTLCDEKQHLQLKSLPPTPGVIAFVIRPKTKGEEDKVGQGLHRLQEEDPTLVLGRDEQTKEVLVTGMGQMHVEITVEKLKRKFGVEVELQTPKVPYRETINGTTKIQGKYKKQTGGRGQYGDCWLELAPLVRGKGFEFVNKIVGGAIPRQYIPAVEKGIVEAMQNGAMAGYPVVDVKVTLYDGSYHDVDSSEMAFKIAGSMAFKKGVLEAKPVLLEPVMHVEITVPEENMGDVMGDINSRRGRVLGMEQKGHTQLIRAQVPMAEVLTYAPDLKSMTAGRGSFIMEFDHYDQLPAHLKEKVVAASQKDRATDES